MLWLVGVCTYRDNFSAQLPVTCEDSLCWIWMAEPIFKTSGVQFDSFPLFYQCAQDFVYHIRKFFIGVELVFVRAVPDCVVNMAVHVKEVEDSKVFQDRFEVFPVSFILCFPNIIFGLIWILAVYLMERANDEIKGIWFYKFGKLFF